jgi:MFS family permease
MKLDYLPITLSAALCAGVALFWTHAPALPASADDVARFADEFAAFARRERVSLFPVGVAASISTWLVLLRHGSIRSRRGRLLVIAAAVMFASGLVTTLAGEPAVKEILRLSKDGSAAAVAPVFKSWTRGHWVTIALGLAALGGLVLAAREPDVDPAAPVTAGSLTQRQRTLLFLLGTATFFHGYDTFIVSMALPYIGRDLGASESTLGFALSAIRVGALVSVVFGRIADRRGRRGLLLGTVLAYTVATGATGFSHAIGDFVLFQLAAQTFLTAEIAIAEVVIAEEFPATFRSTGQGLLGAFNALGAGLAAVLFPALQETPLGWRGLYFVGVTPLLLVAYLRRSLPETARWQAARERGETERARFSELLAPAIRPRFVVLLATSFAIGASTAPAFTFASYRATNVFRWSPSEVSAMVLIGGGVGMLGWFAFGHAAERFGRRLVGVATFAATGLAIVVYFSTPWLWLGFASLVCMEAGGLVALNSLGTELFATRLRSTAKAGITNAAVLGAIAGMAAVGVLGSSLGADSVIRLLALLPLAAAPTFLLVPETQGRELEEI